MNGDSIPSGNRLLGILATISKTLLDGDGYEPSIKKSFRQLSLLMHVDRVYLFQIRKSGKEAVASIQYEYVNSECIKHTKNPELHHIRIREAGYGRWLETFEEGGIIEGHLDDFSAAEQRLLRQQGITSLICIPVFVQDALWGFFGLDFCKERHIWRKRDKLILELFANVLTGFFVAYRKENMLQEQKKRLLQFYELLENIPTEVHLFERETMHFGYMNQTALENLGYDEDEYQELTPNDIVHDMDPEEIIKAILPLINDTQKKIRVETWQKRKDHTVYPVETRLARMQFGTKEHVVALVNDVTERYAMQKALDEEKKLFEDLFRRSADAAMLLEEGRFVDLNEAATNLFGMQRSEILNKSPWELSPPLQPDGTPSELKAEAMLQICNEQGSHRFEWMNCKADGTTFWVDVVITRVRKEGKVLLFTTARDITRRKADEATIINQQNQLASANNILNQRYEEELRLRQELEYYRQQLEAQVAYEVEKNREKDRLLHNQSKNIQMGEMLSMIAHQWRQPLNAITASAMAVSMKQELNALTPKVVAEHAAFVQKHAQGMSRTINDFMDFFKPENEKQQFHMQELMHEIESLIGAQLKSRGVVLRYEAEHGGMILGYRKELSHVLINIIANARDAYENVMAEECYIDIRFVQEPRQWRILVEDFAGGIPPEHIDKIFNPYFTTKEQGKGSGIGLYMSRRIIEEVYKGRLEAENTGAGACFTIIIPSL